MDFMRRVLLVVSAVSLAASIMLAVMWVESYSVEDIWAIHEGRAIGAGINEQVVLLSSGEGELGITLRDCVSPRDGFVGWDTRHIRFRPPIAWIVDSVGSATTYTNMPHWNEHDAKVPYWLAIALLTLPALIYLAIWMRRKKPGLCAVCGYDLRASPDRCPECGTATPVRLSGGSGNPTAGGA
jgi:hypothetical protein